MEPGRNETYKAQREIEAEKAALRNPTAIQCIKNKEKQKLTEHGQATLHLASLHPTPN